MEREAKGYNLRRLKQELEDLYPDDTPIYLTESSKIEILGEKPGEFEVIEISQETGNQEVKYIAKSQRVAGYMLPSELFPSKP